MSKEKNLQFYKKLLPKRLTVEINKTKEDNLWAKVKELPHCYTQAKNFLELIEMINDAVYTYLEIPNKYKKKVGYYFPKKLEKVLQELRNEIKRKQWERFIKEVINKARARKETEVFSLD